nr:hypothetical protein [Phenylobacterium kunshanense]
MEFEEPDLRAVPPVGPTLDDAACLVGIGARLASIAQTVEAERPGGEVDAGGAPRGVGHDPLDRCDQGGGVLDLGVASARDVDPEILVHEQGA